MTNQLNTESMSSSQIEEHIENILISGNVDDILDLIKVGTGLLDQHDIKPTLAQVNRGINRTYQIMNSDNKMVDSWDVAIQWVKRQDYPPTKQQLKYGLLHKCMNVRCAWIMRSDYKATRRQIDEGLADNDYPVRRAWFHTATSSEDFMPTDAQITAGLNDSVMRPYWVGLSRIVFNEEHIGIMLGYFEKYVDPVYDPIYQRTIETLNIRRYQLNESQINRMTASEYFKTAGPNDPVHAFIRSQIAMFSGIQVTSYPKRKRAGL